MTETPQERVDRLANATVRGIPVGKAACGCPNNCHGEFPILHICLVCGFVGTSFVHKACAGCFYLRSKAEDAR